MRWMREEDVHEHSRRREGSGKRKGASTGERTRGRNNRDGLKRVRCRGWRGTAARAGLGMYRRCKRSAAREVEGIENWRLPIR